VAALTAVDSIDWIVAEIAARSLPAGTASAEPKASDGPVEMLRLLKSTKDSAVHARTRAINQLKALLITVPAALREQLQNLGNKDLLQRCAQLRPGAITTPLAAARLALRSLARRIQQRWSCCCGMA
jgi:transposase